MVALLTPSSRKSLSAETSCEPSLFPSSTPLGYTARDTNLTRYVGNSPTNATDPSGLQALSPPAGAGSSHTPEAPFDLTGDAAAPHVRFETGQWFTWFPGISHLNNQNLVDAD